MYKRACSVNSLWAWSRGGRKVLIRCFQTWVFSDLGKTAVFTKTTLSQTSAVNLHSAQTDTWLVIPKTMVHHFGLCHHVLPLFSNAFSPALPCCEGPVNILSAIPNEILGNLQICSVKSISESFAEVIANELFNAVCTNTGAVKIKALIKRKGCYHLEFESLQICTHYLNGYFVLCALP